MILAQVHWYQDTNTVEATWVDSQGFPVKCQSYSDAQMDMLAADLGIEAANYADLIALVRLNIAPYVPPPLADLQEKKRQEIRNAYATMEHTNYTDASLVVWVGGEVSATRLYGAYNLAKESGKLDVIFYDATGKPHTLLLAAALLVCIGVANQNRICFDKKQALMLQIDAALTQADLDLIIW